MANFYADNSLSIGKTPLIKLNRITDGAKATVLAKIEGRNPAYSVKCRIGAAMIWDAEKRGVLKPGIEIVEPTSGKYWDSVGVRGCGTRIQNYADNAGDYVAGTATGAGRVWRNTCADTRTRRDERRD